MMQWLSYRDNDFSAKKGGISVTRDTGENECLPRKLVPSHPPKTTKQTVGVPVSPLNKEGDDTELP
jgi:hypothetical protein